MIQSIAGQMNSKLQQQPTTNSLDKIQPQEATTPLKVKSAQSVIKAIKDKRSATNQSPTK